jgi:hypothetical protein
MTASSAGRSGAMARVESAWEDHGADIAAFEDHPALSA